MVKECSFGKTESQGLSTLSESRVIVILQNNMLKSVPVGYLSNILLVIDLSFNQVTQIHTGEFKLLYNLHELRLQHNLLKLIQPLTFYGLSSLQKLVLASNRISTLSAHSFLGCIISYSCTWIAMILHISRHVRLGV